MPITSRPPSAAVRLFGHVRYSCQRDGCARVMEPDEVFWSTAGAVGGDGTPEPVTTLDPPVQPPPPPNSFRPYCSAEHQPEG